MKTTATGLLLAAALALPAAAQNLLVNGDFKTDLGYWLPWGMQTTWSAADANGALDSGSASLTNVNARERTIELMVQCVAVTPGAKYRLSADVRMPSGQTPKGWATVDLWDYPDSSCMTAGTQGAGSAYLRTTDGPLDAWVPLSVAFAVPAGVHSVEVICNVGKDDAGGVLRALFDDVSLVFLGLPAPKTITIPSSASIHGVNAAFFHTDLWVKNRSYSSPVTITGTYRCQTGFTCPDAVTTFELDPRESVMLTDVVASSFHLPETAGAIELTWDSAIAPVSATSRTYTPTVVDPTNGASVPAMEAADATTRALFLGLGHNGGDRGSGFRSNAGAYNPGTTAATVTFRLVSASGALLGETTRTADPRTPFQINDVFAAVGASSAVTMNAALEVSSTAPVFPFVTVIDNRSGDSVWSHCSADEAP